MSKTSLRDRSFALVMAGLFLFTALATSVVVIISVISSNNSNKASSVSSSTKICSGAVVNTSGKLAGTCLSGFKPVNSSGVTSLKLTDLKLGTGAVATASSTVSVLYTGAVADTGVIFQSSLDNGPQPVTFALNQVIVGWGKGIPGMKVGGERQLLIPAYEAYGANPPSGSGIPANSALVFNVTLLAVK
jgi:FKBP-type peptidyl-prolyl cis-trans isomerase FkpA